MYRIIITLKVCSTHLKVSTDLVPGRSRGEDKVTYLENEVGQKQFMIVPPCLLLLYTI